MDVPTESGVKNFHALREVQTLAQAVEQDMGPTIVGKQMAMPVVVLSLGIFSSCTRLGRFS